MARVPDTALGRSAAGLCAVCAGRVDHAAVGSRRGSFRGAADPDRVPGRRRAPVGCQFPHGDSVLPGNARPHRASARRSPRPSAPKRLPRVAQSEAEQRALLATAPDAGARNESRRTNHLGKPRCPAAFQLPGPDILGTTLSGWFPTLLLRDGVERHRSEAFVRTAAASRRRSRACASTHPHAPAIC